MTSLLLCCASVWNSE